MTTTNVLDVETWNKRSYWKTASKWDFPCIAQVLTYPEDREISKVRSSMASSFKILEEFNKKLSLNRCLSNHAGNHVGAPIWDLPLFLRLPKT